MDSICPPALIYLAFSLTQIIIDTFKGLYNTAFFKFIVMITITILLNTLCQGGMSVISWILVFIPFMFMTVIVAILLYVFGLDAATGTLNFKCDNPNQNSNTNTNTNLIYSSTTKTNATTNANATANANTSPISTSSDPQFQ
jgi:hypothetical protein